MLKVGKMEKPRKGFCKNICAKLRSCGNRKNYDSSNDNTEPIHLALMDMCIYLIFLIATTILMMSTRDISMYYLDQVIERVFVNRPTLNEQEFELTYKDLVTVSDWWSFIETTFVEGIVQFRQQDKTHRLSIERNTLIGLPRLRQIRVRNETCTIHDAFRYQFRTCYGTYSQHNEDVSGFLNATHLTKNEINTNAVWGRIATYHGAGYIEMLSLQADKTKEIIENLKASSWIDRATRAILIEFVLFNANVNVFCNVKFLAEIPPSGGILTSSTIHALSQPMLWKGYFECIFAVIFYGLILYYTFDIALGIIAFGCVRFFCSMWNFLDFIIVLLGYLILGYAIWHTLYLNTLLGSYSTNKASFYSFDIICYWNMYCTAAVGLCVFLVWIKILKYIKLSKTMLQFSTTIGKCAADVFGFAIMFAIVLLAYANLSVLLFGSVHRDFRDFPTAMLTMLRMILGDFNYEEMEEASKILAPIFFLSYVLFVFFILLNMFLAIIFDTYSDVKSEITHGEGPDFVKYIMELLKKLRTNIVPAKKDTTSGREVNGPLMPIKRLTDQMVETVPKRNNRFILNSQFEIISIPRTLEEQDALLQRIKMLEQSLARLFVSLYPAQSSASTI